MDHDYHKNIEMIMKEVYNSTNLINLINKDINDYIDTRIITETFLNKDFEHSDH